MIDIDDKDLGMTAVTIIAIMSMFTLPEHAHTISLAVVSAIAGFVTGKSKVEKKKND